MTAANTLFFNALESAPIPHFMLDKNGHVILWNRACAEFTGVQASDILHTDLHWKVFYPEEPKKRITLADLVLLERQQEISLYYSKQMNPQIHGDTLQAERWLFKPGSTRRYVIFNAAPVYGDKGEVLGAIETLQDVTDRITKETLVKDLVQDHNSLSVLLSQVSQAKEQWEKTMDCIDDLVLLIDPDGQIERCNRMVTELVGQPYREILGKPWKDLILTEQMDARNVSENEAELFHGPSNRWFYLKRYAVGNYGERKTIGEVVTLHDITELKKVSSQLEQAYKELTGAQSRMLQAEKMATIGQLAAGVAHEINNPIGFVNSNLTTLGKYVGRLTSYMEKQGEIIADLGGKEAERELQDLQKKLKLDFILADITQLTAESLDGTERVRKIVQDLKSFSRVDDSDRREVDLNECMESTLTIVWNELKYNTVIDRNYGELPLVSCYPQQINQVFMNLLVNAGHAIEGNGVIEICSWYDRGQAFVSVRDTGCGIPAENVGQLFEPFFTTKKAGKGTGLGLSISFDIVKKHGGEILVESTVGEGSTFTVVLPVNQET